MSKSNAKRVVGDVAAKDEDPIVTPGGEEQPRQLATRRTKTGPRRNLFGTERTQRTGVELQRRNPSRAETLTDVPDLSTAATKRKASIVTPSSSTGKGEYDDSDTENKAPPTAKRRLLFGRYVELVQCAPNVDMVYKIVRKLTGNLGGNGYSGPIYGELTKHSMQKMIDLMIKETEFSSQSRFIDVGSGIGKPNLHVAQYPGVEFSCGVEMEHNRWSLGMTCLKACLNAAVLERKGDSKEASNIQGNTMFLHNNILEAKTLDPFTHVYMFSIGFPPDLWMQLSEMWNQSDPESCRYLICYAGPKDIIESYEFHVELLAQMPTSMHGSKESHMGYIYRRKEGEKKSSKKKQKPSKKAISCDPLFEPSYALVKEGLESLSNEVDRQVEAEMGGSRRTRGSQQKTIFSKC